MKNQFGKTSKLHLEATLKDDKTILSDVSFTSPFKIMRPFYEKKDTMSVMILMASAGTMAGDHQEIEIQVKENANMEVISQAYDKIHRMEEGFAERMTSIRLESGAKMYYNPLPIIPFAGSDYRSGMKISLTDESSQFILSEILTCGRVAHGETFLYRKFQNNVKVYQNDKIIYHDNTCYEPEWMEMQDVGLYEGYTHLANLLLCNVNKSNQWIQQVREKIDSDEAVEGGVTQTTTGCINVRILGSNGDKLIKMQKEILALKELDEE